MRIPANSSYDTDESTYFLEFLKKHSHKEDESEFKNTIFEQRERLLYMTESESNALYTMAGWATFKESSRIKQCSDCRKYITGDISDASKEADFIKLKSYGWLTHPSKQVFDAIKFAA